MHVMAFLVPKMHCWYYNRVSVVPRNPFFDALLGIGGETPGLSPGTPAEDPLDAASDGDAASDVEDGGLEAEESHHGARDSAPPAKRARRQ